MPQPEQLRRAMRERKKLSPEERAAERRPRFLERQVPWVRHAKRALKRVQKLGNATHHDYSQEEAKAILATLDESMAAVRRAFQGAPKEKGLFDL